MQNAIRPAAVDMGSSSVRVMSGSFDGARLELTETARFPHEAREDNGQLVWALDGLIANVDRAIRALTARDAISSVGVDSWGVDHVLVDAQGTPVLPATCYRDQRTANVEHWLAEHGFDREAQWLATGTQPDQILTSYQLIATLRDQSTEKLAEVDKVLMLSDYVAYRLGADPGWSQGISSTSGLTAPGANEWANSIFETTGIPRNWFGEISPEGTISGHLLGSPKLPIIRSGTHDTACAVHALPVLLSGTGRSDNRAFLVSGSWSLLGIETDQPVLDMTAFRAGMTNEARTDGGNRLLFNITGLWILQECVRQWEREDAKWSWADLTAAARAARSTGALVDTGSPEFQVPGDMPKRVSDAVVAAGGPRLTSPGEITRVVLESLATRYAQGLAELVAVTGIKPDYLAVVGGGSSNALLNELTADACGIPLVIGPSEATSIGSMLAQLETIGEILPSDRGEIIAASGDVKIIAPSSATRS